MGAGHALLCVNYFLPLVLFQVDLPNKLVDFRYWECQVVIDSQGEKLTAGVCVCVCVCVCACMCCGVCEHGNALWCVCVCVCVCYFSLFFLGLITDLPDH